MITQIMDSLTKFISSLSKIGKIIFVIAFIAVFMLILDIFLVSPMFSKMASIEQETEKETNIIKQDMHFLTYKKKINSQSKAYEPYLATDNLTEAEIKEAFLKKIESLSKKANIVINKTTPSEAMKDKEVVKYAADIECSGVLADLVTFMHLVNTSDELMKVVKYNFSSKKADTDEIKAVMTIHRVVIPQRD